MKLEQSIDAERLKVMSDSYQMSIGELAHLYVSGELKIDPDFQREIRWADPQKVRFIESILLQFPLPAIFVASQSNGTWDLLDGLQRISTIFEFLGILRSADGEAVAPLSLHATERFPGLAGIYFRHDFGAPSLPERLQTEFKRQRLDVKIILRQSQPEMLFDLFTRLAIGGTQLSTQDVRNALISKADSAFRIWLNDLVRLDDYRSALSLSDNDLKQRYEYELALVFLMVANDSEDDLSLISDLDEGLNALVKNDSRLYEYDRSENRDLFVKTFCAMSEMGANAFERKGENAQASGLSRAAFVAITSAIVNAIKSGQKPDATKVVNEFWNLDEMPKSFADQVRWGRSMP